MAIVIPDQLDDLLALQGGIVSRSQAVQLGVSRQLIDSQLRAGRWRQVQFGVYATFTGELSRRAVLWAAVLRAGPGAALSHQSAAELYRISPPADPVHVTIPTRRKLVPVTGLVIHRSGALDRSRHPALAPPRTRIEDTLLDLAEAARSLDEAISWLSRGCGARLTTAFRLAAAARGRPRLRLRPEMRLALGDTGNGAQSILEHRYVRSVERPHGLPSAERQVQSAQLSLPVYRDNLYADFGVCVELDGLAAHPVHDRWRDQRRDNAAAAQGLITLRYNWADVHDRPCETATEVAAVLRSRGWRGSVRPCSAACTAAALGRVS